MDFVTNHIWLISVALISGGMLIWPILARLASGAKEVGVFEATQLINKENAIVIDIRRPEEFEQGHLPGAKNLPIDSLGQQLGNLEKYKAQPCIVYCQLGSRSVIGAGLLKKNGFAQTFSLKGGVDAWRQANMPLEKS